MPVLHSRRLGGDPRIRCDQRRVNFYPSEYFLQHLFVNKSGPQYHRLVLCEIDNGGFQPDPHLSAVDDHLHSAVKILQTIFCQSRAGPSGSVGAGSRDITARRVDQGLRDLIARKSHRNSIQAPCRLLRDQAALFKDHSQRAWPKGLGKLLRLRRYFPDDGLYIFQPAYMHDQRVVRGSSLRFVYLSGGFRVKRVAAQPVHCLSRKSDKAAFLNDPPCPPDRRQVRRLLIHNHIFCCHCFLSGLTCSCNRR